MLWFPQCYGRNSKLMKKINEFEVWWQYKHTVIKLLLCVAEVIIVSDQPPGGVRPAHQWVTFLYNYTRLSRDVVIVLSHYINIKDKVLTVAVSEDIYFMNLIVLVVGDPLVTSPHFTHQTIHSSLSLPLLIAFFLIVFHTRLSWTSPHSHL